MLLKTFSRSRMLVVKVIFLVILLLLQGLSMDLKTTESGALGI